MQRTHLLILIFSGMIVSCSRTPSFTLTPASETPQIFDPNGISSGFYERDFALNPERDFLIYTQGDYSQQLRVLVGMKRSGSAWSEPFILPFSGSFQDIEPFFTPDGKNLFFVSNRPMNNNADRNDYNIWKVAYQNGNWGEPLPLDTLINGKGNEFYPAIANSGNLYFTATPENGRGREDILFAAPLGDGYVAPKLLDSTINTAAYEFNAYISPDEDLLIFSSFGRADDMGGGDLYYTVKNRDGDWLPAQNMGTEINSSKLDYCPFWDREAEALFFTSERNSFQIRTFNDLKEFKELANGPGNGLGDIYSVKWSPNEHKSNENPKP